MSVAFDDILNKRITIKQGIEMGIVSARVLTDADIFVRVQSIMEEEQIPKTHAVEKLSNQCKVSERNIWYSYSFTAKLIAVE
jgi:methenyltetrahydromethanopterin cyclohydrolase